LAVCAQGVAGAHLARQGGVIFPFSYAIFTPNFTYSLLLLVVRVSLSAPAIEKAKGSLCSDFHNRAERFFDFCFCQKNL
jgi:hypothetical protein